MGTSINTIVIMAIDDVFIDRLSDRRGKSLKKGHQTGILMKRLLAIGLSAAERSRYAKQFATEYASWRASAIRLLAAEKLIHSKKFTKLRKARARVKEAFREVAAFLDSCETVRDLRHFPGVGPACLGCPMNNYNRAIRAYEAASKAAMTRSKKGSNLRVVTDYNGARLAYNVTYEAARAHYKEVCNRKDNDYNRAYKAYRAARKMDWAAREAFCSKVRKVRGKASGK